MYDQDCHVSASRVGNNPHIARPPFPRRNETRAGEMDGEQALRDAVNASVDAMAAFQAAGANKRKRDEDSWEEQKREWS